MNTYPVINTNSGPIKGRSRSTDENKEYFSFQNIPYVKSFNRETRFRDPVPVEVWNEILDATEEGPSFYNIDPYSSRENLCEGTLNTLGINIFTPNLTPAEPLPVFIYIHGGAFINGSSSTAIYGPDYIIERNIIMVSFNYRLNIFGFLSFHDPELGIPGNAGLKDQNLALKWIKANISYFGGDPNNITLCGESAGGASVNYHMISPMSKNLFHRAIIMSGSAFAPWASIPSDYEKYMRRLMSKLGLEGNKSEDVVFKRICETEPEQLLKYTLDIVDFDDRFFGPLLLSPFVPRKETYDNGNCFLHESYENLSIDAWSNDIDVMIGGCSDEGMYYYLCDPTDDDISKVNQDNSLLLPLELQQKLNSEEKHVKGRLMKEVYFGKDNLITKDKATEYCMIQYFHDKINWYPMYRTIQYRRTSRHKSNTFLYRIDLPPSKDVPEYYEMIRTQCKVPHRDGTGHGEDLPLLFKTNVARRFKPGDDHYLSWQKFLHVFTNFIKTGNPNNHTTQDIEQWKPISKSHTDDTIQCLEMNTSIHWEMCSLVNWHKLQYWTHLCYD